jgi:hypothetical protein
MTKFVGVFVMLIGIANRSSASTIGNLILLIGLYILGFGMAGAGGFGIAVTVSLPFLGYAIAGGSGAFIGIVLLIGLATCAVKQNKKKLLSTGFAIEEGTSMTERRYPGLALWKRLEAMHPATALQRRKDESRHDFQQRESNEDFSRGHNEFEIEVVSGSIVTPTGQRVIAGLHRIVLYRKPARYSKTSRKESLEVKINKFLSPSSSVPARGPVTCLNPGDFPASLIQQKSYRVLEGSVRVGDMTFLRLVDESNEPYFYPQSLFTPASIERNLPVKA